MVVDGVATEAFGSGVDEAMVAPPPQDMLRILESLERSQAFMCAKSKLTARTAAAEMTCEAMDCGCCGPRSQRLRPRFVLKSMHQKSVSPGCSKSDIEWCRIC